MPNANHSAGEVLGKDASKLCRFYGALFGWSFGGDPAATHLAERLGVSERTVYRDIRDLDPLPL